MLRSNNQEVDNELIYQWIIELTYPSMRENALSQLSQKREGIPNLAPMLWHSFGTIAALLQEIISIYPSITPPILTAHQSNRVCNALAIMQCIAMHSETKLLFLEAQIPLFLYPFLRTTSKERPFEYLRLTSLGVIGSLVKADNEEVISFLVSSKIIPLILRIMENGTELPRTVATFILQRILMDEGGLMHVCQTFDRFSHVAMILGKLVLIMASEPSVRLLKHVVLCYLRLSDNQHYYLNIKCFVLGRMEVAKAVERLDWGAGSCALPEFEPFMFQSCSPWQMIGHHCQVLRPLLLAILERWNKCRKLCAGLHKRICFVAKEALRQCLPDQLRDSTFALCLSEDKYIKQWLQQLLKNLEPQSDQVMAVFETKRMFFFNPRLEMLSNSQVRGKDIIPQTGTF